jgi:choice-of-anchor A domain-containing protein
VFAVPSRQALRKFHMMSFGPFTGPGGSDVQGYLAVNGNTFISNYSVSDQMTPPSGPDVWINTHNRSVTSRDDFVVCGDLTFVSGAVMGGGNLVYTGADSVIGEPLASVYAPGVIKRVSECPVNFDDARERLRELSRGLATLTRTGTSVIEYTQLQLVGTLTGLNVFRVSASDLLTITDISLELPRLTSWTTVVINVMFDDDYTGPYRDPSGTADEDRTKATDINMVAFGKAGLFENTSFVSRVLWNFPYAATMNVSYVGFRGSILAPDAGKCVVAS